jgi:hypothetical protein
MATLFTSHRYLVLSKGETLSSYSTEIKHTTVISGLSERINPATNLEDPTLKPKLFRASQRQISLRKTEYYQRIFNYNQYLKN